MPAQPFVDSHGTPSLSFGPPRFGPHGATRQADGAEREGAAAAALRRMDEHPISRPKITPALLRESTLRRDRLIERLREGAERRLTLIVAEAGYGKTTLLADFSDRHLVRCLWFKLDSSDRDWVSFITYLVAAGREALASFAPATAELLRASNPGREATIASFIAELPELATERTVLILDDYNAVDDSPDVQEIVGRILADGPEALSLMVVTRREPPLRIGRLAAQDQLVELSTDDLRFSRSETDELFAEVYRQPLERELIDEIKTRTEGWAASLQLLHSSIRERSPSEIRAFVHRLSGAEGRLYDFLADEVLHGLPPVLARFMVHASLLERIVPDHVVALFAPDHEPATAATVEEWIRDVADLGLAAKRSEASQSYRFHPLLRDFLQRRLRESVPSNEIRDMHLRVARVAESDDWLTACRHYLEGGATNDAMRVLDASVLEAIGAGLWEPAAALVDAQSLERLDPATSVILARRELALGFTHRALARLDAIDLAAAPPLARALALQAKATASWIAGDDAAVVEATSALRRDAEAPQIIKDIADALVYVRDASRGGSLFEFIEHLRRILPHQLRDGLHFYAATTLHNLCWAHLHLGDYAAALEFGERSMDERLHVAASADDSGATLAALAECSLELGLWNQGLDYLARAAGSSEGQLDAICHVATLFAALGERDEARRMLDRAQELIAADRGHPTGPLELWRASTVLRLSVDLIDDDPAEKHLVDIAARSVLAYLRAATALVGDSMEQTLDAVRDGEPVILRQSARHWLRRLRIIGAIAAGDGKELARRVEAPDGSEFLILELAPAIADALHLTPEIPAAVRTSIQGHPNRWLPELRRQLRRGYNPTAMRAAELLDQCGTKEDVVVLRAFERTYLKGSRARGLGRALRRRTAVPLLVQDLGRTRIEVGPRRVLGTDMRRRALALLLYLATRPSMTATRDQVLESLWPDADPESATNSLHQTLFFLRRDIEPWFDEDTSFSYASNEGDLVWLDDRLVSGVSATFVSRVASLPRSASAEARAAALEMYTGHFAPEFEYEDWAMAWRDRLHAQFLALGELQVRDQWAAGSVQQAIATAQRVLALDGDAVAFEAALVALYAQTGTDAAAGKQYEHYAARHRELLGSEPEEMAKVVALTPAGLRTVY